ncbi:MAG: hypothetical protein M3Z46_04045 [Actinomycetota bacterium]|nr:hypothetical protein [Actinomycetota bacterium]
MTLLLDPPITHPSQSPEQSPPVSVPATTRTVRTYLAQGQWTGARSTCTSARLVVRSTTEPSRGVTEVAAGTPSLSIQVDTADPDGARRAVVSAYRWMHAQGMPAAHLVGDRYAQTILRRAAEVLIFSGDPAPASVS